MFEDYDPGLGITRIRYNGYNLSLKVRHPSEISAAKVRKKTGNTSSERSLCRKKGKPQKLSYREPACEKKTLNLSSNFIKQQT